jgi:hypothetical protein
MAQFRLGRTADSERTFDDATRRADSQGADDHPYSWPDQLEYDLLRREAQALIRVPREPAAIPQK